MLPSRPAAGSRGDRGDASGRSDHRDVRSRSWWWWFPAGPAVRGPVTCVCPQGDETGFISDASDGEVSVTLTTAAAMRSEPSAALATSVWPAAGVPSTVRGSLGRYTVN